MITLYQQFWINLVLLLSWLTTKFRYGHCLPKAPGEVRGILVFQLTELGDVVLATDILRRLREHYPHSRIIMACGPWAKPVIDGQPFVDEVVAYQSNLNMTAKREKLNLWQHWLSVQEMAQLPVDLIVDLRGNIGSIVTAWISPARYRVDRGSVRWNNLIRGSKESWDRHETDLNLEIVRSLELSLEAPRLELHPFEEAEKSLTTKLESHKFALQDPFVVLHPGASWEGKRWREERFTMLAEQILTETEFQVVLTGSKGEQATGDAIMANLHRPATNLIGALSLQELLTLYTRSTLWVGNDTGTMHIAVALGCSVVVLWGPTKLAKFGPIGGNAQVIYGTGAVDRGAPPRALMDLIPVSDVWKVVQAKLKKENLYAAA